MSTLTEMNYRKQKHPDCCDNCQQCTGNWSDGWFCMLTYNSDKQMERIPDLLYGICDEHLRVTS